MITISDTGLWGQDKIVENVCRSSVVMMTVSFENTKNDHPVENMLSVRQRGLLDGCFT